VSDIDTEAVDGLKVLDPKRPIREADIEWSDLLCRTIVLCEELVAVTVSH
jgi:hypothetical protein